MRPFRLVVPALIVPLAVAIAGPASAQTDIVRELQRKAMAGEQDGGFCQRAAARLEKLSDAQLRARMNELLGRGPDAQRREMLFAMTEIPSAQPALLCFQFIFQPAAMREGEKCRATLVYVCLDGRDCATKTDGVICEKSPGVWE